MEDFVPIMVPRDHVNDVYVHLGRLLDGATAPPTPAPDRLADAVDRADTDSLGDSVREWGPDLVGRSWAESPPSMRSVLRHLAEAADQWIPIHDLARVAYPDTGSRQQLAGALGAWGHRCSSRYGAATRPFETRWNHGTQLYEYRMAPHFADLYGQHFA